MHICVLFYSVGLCQFQPKGCAADVEPILLGKCLTCTVQKRHNMLLMYVCSAMSIYAWTSLIPRQSGVECWHISWDVTMHFYILVCVLVVWMSVFGCVSCNCGIANTALTCLQQTAALA